MTRPALGQGSDLPGCGMLVLCALVAWLAYGCSTNAYRVHAVTALAAMTAEGVAEDAYLAHLDASLAECDHESICLARVNQEHAPAEAALTSTHAAIVLYEDAIRIAVAAEGGEDVIAALVGLVARLVEQWALVRAAFEALGLTVPALPVIGGAS